MLLQLNFSNEQMEFTLEDSEGSLNILSCGFLPHCIPACSPPNWLLQGFDKSTQFWVDTIDKNPKTIENLFITDCKLKVQHVSCKASVQECLQQAAPVPNVYVVQGSRPTKRVMPKPQVVVSHRFQNNGWFAQLSRVRSLPCPWTVFQPTCIQSSDPTIPATP